MRPPVPPFSEGTARQKVQAAERNRNEFLTGRPAIVEFLRRQVAA